MSEVHARILIWGIDGSGKTTTLETIHAKLRPDLRGELRREPTRLDPTVEFESLAISLGEIGGVSTQLEIIAVPGAPDQAMTRKQLLDEVDGIVIVLDASPARIDANYAAIDELRASLASYGRRLDAFPVVLQYNKRDIADPFAIEELHRRIGLDQAAVFETIATSGHGILATLTTISKYVVRSRRSEGASTSPSATGSTSFTTPTMPTTTPTTTKGSITLDITPPTTPTAAAEVDFEVEDSAGSSHAILEAAILADADDEAVDAISDLVELDPTTGVQPDWDAISESAAKPEGGLGFDLRIVSVGQASLDTDGGVRLSLVLGDEGGQTRSVVLSLRLDALVSDGND
jgi:signal recognition particle receptor subunit beta